MQTKTDNYSQTINDLCLSFYRGATMAAGIRLDIFGLLSQEPRSSAELAAILNADTNKLSPLLYALVSIGLLTVTDGVFANTRDAGQFLVKGSSTYKGTFIDYMFGAVMKSDESIRTGKPQAKIEYTALPPDILMHIYRGLHPCTYNAGIDLSRDIDFSRYRHLLDVAGGSGGLALGICACTPGIEATVLELPSVVEITTAFINEAGASDRVHVVSTDITLEAPIGTYDCVIMRYFVQVIAPADALRAFKNCFQAMISGSTLYIIGKLLHNTRTSPVQSVLFNLVFINIYPDGTSHTEQEIVQWLEEAGFCDIQIQNNLPPYEEAIVSAQKKVI